MALFDTEDLTVCPICHGTGVVYDERVDADRPCKCQFPDAAGDDDG